MKRILYILNEYLFLVISAGFISLIATVSINLFSNSFVSKAEEPASYEVFGIESGIEDIKRASRALSIKDHSERVFDFSIVRTDFRELVFDYYLSSEQSPLSGLGGVFVENCNLYNAPRDCTAVLAIARVETDLCKYGPSQEQFNCWGYGGAGENRYQFESYEEAIKFVTQKLVNAYGPRYMIDPNAMEYTYCGQRPSCGTWGDKVQSEMNKLNKLSVDLGYASLFSLR